MAALTSWPLIILSNWAPGRRPPARSSQAALLSAKPGEKEEAAATSDTAAHFETLVAKRITQDRLVSILLPHERKMIKNK